MTDGKTRTWVAHFIFAQEDGQSASAVREISAQTYHDAYDLAVRMAPATEFVVSVSEKSDEQSLGFVRFAADRLKTND